MKKSIKLLILMLLLGSSTLSAQRIVSYYYDNTGNRIRRNTITIAAKTTRDTTEISDEDIAEDLSKIEEKYGSESLAGGQITIFPNPVEEALMVRLENISNIESISLQLYNSSGSILQTKQVNSNYSEFNMHEFSPGVYILRIVRQEEQLEYKIIKQ